MDYFQSLLTFFQQNSELGVAILSFLDACISPIVPDIIFIPASIANPENALKLAWIATFAATFGAFFGYFIGYQFSDYAQRKIIPKKHMDYVRNLVDKYGVWAVFWGAMAPIPYKFVAISAGILRLNLGLYAIATFLGRAKRFLIIGIPVHYFGPTVIPLVLEYSKQAAILLAILLVIFIAYLYYRKKQNKQSQ